jgi:hypothetical protein
MDAPKLPSVFRNVRREPKRFGYRPKFYDPKAEELEERKKKIEAEIARDQGQVVNNKPYSVKFQRAHKRNSLRGMAFGSNVRLVIILAILLFLIFAAVQWLESF